MRECTLRPVRILHAGSHSLTARHVPWVYWVGAALLLWATYQEVHPGLADTAQWVEALFPAAVALLILLLWGQVVQVEIDRRRRRVVLKRWGLLGLRVRAFPADKVAAIYLERHTREGRLTQHRMVLMDPAQRLVALTPYSLMELGMGHTAEQLYEYLQESRAQPAPAGSARA